MKASTAVSWESLPWTSGTSEAGDVVASRRQRLAARGPYRAAVPATIADLQLELPNDTAAAAEDALVEIIRFDAELSRALPPAGVGATDGELAPLAAVLLRTESASSSQIENVTAGAKALALASLHERAGDDARLVAANVDALQRAIDLSDDLGPASILAAHHALLGGHDYAQPGRWRDGQVWIGGAAPSPHTATFVPPHADRVPDAMADLFGYARRTDVPVLPHVAIAHAQFETIHPFADGNGRLGRALVHAMLRRAGATRGVTVPVSAGLLTDTGTYFDALMSFRDGDPAPIVDRFTEAAFAAVRNGRALASELTRIHATWTDRLTARRGAAAWSALPLLIRQPAVTVAYLGEQVGVSQPAALRAVNQLVDAGILKPATANRRNRVWVAQGVVQALDEFAARARRQ